MASPPTITTIKTTLGKDVRRFNAGTLLSDFHRLSDYIRGLYPTAVAAAAAEAGGCGADLICAWGPDDDGDFISVRGQSDLDEAVSQCPDSVLRLHLTAPPTYAAAAPIATAATAAKVDAVATTDPAATVVPQATPVVCSVNFARTRANAGDASDGASNAAATPVQTSPPSDAAATGDKAAGKTPAQEAADIEDDEDNVGSEDDDGGVDAFVHRLVKDAHAAMAQFAPKLQEHVEGIQKQFAAKQQQWQEEQNSVPPSSNAAVHACVVCDVCSVPIVGSRFKCTVCPDYDLCGTCEPTGAHPQHPLVRFRNPRETYTQRGRGGGGGGCGRRCGVFQGGRHPCHDLLRRFCGKGGMPRGGCGGGSQACGDGGHRGEKFAAAAAAAATADTAQQDAATTAAAMPPTGADTTTAAAAAPATAEPVNDAAAAAAPWEAEIAALCAMGFDHVDHATMMRLLQRYGGVADVVAQLVA